GNTCLYGATSGELFAAGHAGERFAVRNSGATAVVEGCGANGCEYMTGGEVLVLGPVGDNFGAGMTGGRVFVHDPGGTLQDHLNTEDVVRLPLGKAEDECRDLILRHFEATGSDLARQLIDSWESSRDSFALIQPVGIQTEATPVRVAS
ncbi:MAG: hypothetical protein AAGA69_10505, partial [Pseudomonadota bacterium]